MTRTPLYAFIAPAALGCLLAGCIKNDIPYPRIQPNFLTMEAPGLLQPAVIDSASRQVKLIFNEETNLADVRISSYTITPGSEIVSGNLHEPINLLQGPYNVTLKMYQTYDWMIFGQQSIERYFTVFNQVGPAVIDVDEHRVSVKVTENPGLGAVQVLSCKLGATGSVTTPELQGAVIDLTQPLEVTVTTHGRPQTWTISAEQVAQTVATVRVDAWTNVAWVYGDAMEGRDNGVEYRQKGLQQWLRCPKDWVTTTGTTFFARIINLQPLTQYEARTYSESEYGAQMDFTTGSIEQVPNSSLGEWHKSGKLWNPWPEGGTPYWDTGNKGATTLGASNSVPTTETSTGTGTGALLQTKFVGIGPLGKLAAGNIFTGVYVRTVGTNGVLTFGRPFSQRPTRLRGYYKYKTAPMNKVSKELPQDWLGKPDTCNIYCALIDSPEPLEIRTSPSDRQLFDPEASYIVAYGHVQSGEDIPDFVHFDIPLTYNATDRVPTYIVIVASASKYGDYFTGGDGACLWLDDLDLEYDY